MARATSALAFALLDDEAGLHEAIYEAVAALDTPDELERLVGAALGASAAPKSAEEIQGLELDWLGSDADGHVALFSTAGAGFAPAEFLRDTDAHDEAIGVVLALPASTAAKFAPAVAPGLTNTWKLVAERGLYAFDCDPNGGPYRLVAAPVVPIRVDALPSTAAGVVARIRLGLRFETTGSILFDPKE